MNSTDSNAPTPRRFIDPQLLTVLDMLNERTELAQKGYISVDDMTNLIGRLMTEPCVAELHLGKDNYDRVRTDLCGYIEARFSKKPTSIVIVLGYVLSVDSVLNTPKPSTPNIDAMLRSQEAQTTRDMFQPFLIRQIYSYLVGKAAAGQTTTYEAIANEFGLPNKGNQLGRTLSPLLSSVYKFCERTHQPFLTIIVVRKSGELKGLPGEGFWSLYNGASSPVLACTEIADRRERTASLQAQVFEYWGYLGQ